MAREACRSWTSHGRGMPKRQNGGWKHSKRRSIGEGTPANLQELWDLPNFSLFDV